MGLCEWYGTSLTRRVASNSLNWPLVLSEFGTTSHSTHSLSAGPNDRGGTRRVYSAERSTAGGADNTDNYLSSVAGFAATTAAGFAATTAGMTAMAAYATNTWMHELWHIFTHFSATLQV